MSSLKAEELKSDAEYNSIKKNSAFNAIKTCSAILFPLMTFPYISRVLLPENVGKINFGTSIVSYYGLMATLGINTYAIRECSAVRNDKEKLSDTASQIFSINIITTILAYVALLFTLIFYQQLFDYRFLILIQSVTIVASTMGADWLNSAMEDFKYITIRTVVFQMISLCLMFVFIHRPEDYLKYAVISIISGAGASVVNIWYRRRYCAVRFIFNIRRGIEWRKHITPIIYLFVMILAQTIFNNIDTTMLGLIHGDYEVGIYGAAHKMSNLITQLVTSLLWVIMPRMSYYFAEGDYTAINKLLRKILGFNAFLGLPLAIGTIMISDDIILIMAGSEYVEAANVLRILMIGFIFTLFGGSFLGNSILLPSKRERTFMITCCITAVVNVITNYIFIPRYGAIAAAGTTVFCALTILVILLFKIDNRIHIERVFNVFSSPLLGCLAIVVVCYVCKGINTIWVRTALSILSSIFLYGLIVYFGENDLMIELISGVKARFSKA